MHDDDISKLSFEKNLPLWKWRTQLAFKAIELEIAYERIRQARHSYNLALMMTAVCSTLAITGGVLLANGKIPEGAVATAGGAAPIVSCLKFAREANDRLDKLLMAMKSDKANNQFLPTATAPTASVPSSPDPTASAPSQTLDKFHL